MGCDITGGFGYDSPEGIQAGAKAHLEERMQPGASYLETTDQPALTALFSLADAYRRSRSFRKLASSFARLARALGQEINEWPPARWAADH